MVLCFPVLHGIIPHHLWLCFMLVGWCHLGCRRSRLRRMTWWRNGSAVAMIWRRRSLGTYWTERSDHPWNSVGRTGHFDNCYVGLAKFCNQCWAITILLGNSNMVSHSTMALEGSDDGPGWGETSRVGWSGPWDHLQPSSLRRLGDLWSQDVKQMSTASPLSKNLRCWHGGAWEIWEGRTPHQVSCLRG